MSKDPGRIQSKKSSRTLYLATNEKGWLATGMDDIYEHRIPLRTGAELESRQLYVHH